VTRTERLLEITQRLAEERPDFFDVKRPGTGDEAGNAFEMEPGQIQIKGHIPVKHSEQTQNPTKNSEWVANGSKKRVDLRDRTNQSRTSS
jgi:hypothetical protein